jgi:hypothetical protein
MKKEEIRLNFEEKSIRQKSRLCSIRILKSFSYSIASQAGCYVCPVTKLIYFFRFG